MNTTSTLARTAAVIAGIALAAPAFAATIDLGASGSGSASDSSYSGTTTVGVTTSHDEPSEGDASANDSTISVDRADVEVNGSTGINVDPLIVNTHDDLSAYASATLQGDDHVHNVSASEEEVSLEYAEHAHLFGVFPVVVTATATADANGEVKVRYPWYRFLMSTEREALETSVSAEVSTVMNGSASAQMSAQTQARVLAAMHRAMKSHFDAVAAAEVEGDATVN